MNIRKDIYPWFFYLPPRIPGEEDTMDISKIINQAIGIITNPKDGLTKLKNEKATMQDIIIYLAIIGVPTFIGVFLGYGFIYSQTSVGGVVGWGFGLAIIQYILSIGGLIVFAFIMNELAPKFGSKQNKMHALKMIAAAATPWLIAGIFSIIPSLSLLSLIGLLYGLYILYIGLPIFMETPKDQEITYLIVGLILFIVVFAVISAIISTIWTSVVLGGYYGLYGYPF